MTIACTPPPARRPARRQGTTLVVTMIVIATVASILAVSTEQMLGMHVLEGSHLATQTNAYAAESCAGMIEGFLENATNNDPALVQDIAPATPPTGVTAASLAQTWNNYAGYTGNFPIPNPYAPGSSKWPNMWINNCLVIWRIEPVTIYDTTFGSTFSAGSWSALTPPTGGMSTVNYNAVLPTTGTTGTSVNNPGFFQYRLLVTAYTIDPKMLLYFNQTMATATPWACPGEASAVSQVQREIQLHLLNLFQYVIFYAAVGPAGDIEFHPGGALTITGAVHSNGAIYFGGTSLAGTNYHAATNQGGQITIGTAAQPVGIDAPGGIFRMQKDVNALFAINTGLTQVLNPALVPQRNNLIGSIAMSGTNDLNGDTDSNTNILLNGTALVSTNDTRSGLKVANGTKYIRDSSSGSGVVSLSNFPDLKGYAFEPQSFVPSADTGNTTPLYWKGIAPSGMAQTWNQYEFTINSQLYPNAQPLFYQYQSGNIAYPGISNTATSYPVYATDMPLWVMQNPIPNSGTYLDVWPTGKYVPGYYNMVVGPGGWYVQSGPGSAPGVGTLSQQYLPKISINKGYLYPTAKPSVPSTLDTYLPEVVLPQAANASGYPYEGHYFAQSLHGAAGTSTTGLTIRERGAPNLLFTFDLVEHPPTVTGLPQQGHLIMADTPPFWCVPDCTGAAGLVTGPDPNQLWGAEWLNAYAAMMMSRYAVYLSKDSAGNPFDITIPFFRYGLGNGGCQPTCHSWNGVGNINGPCNVQYFNWGALESIESGATTWIQHPIPTGLLATSDTFVNVREGAWLENNRYLNTSSTPTPASYQVDALTLNIGQICAFISTTTWNTVSTNAQQASLTGPGTLLSALFNGVIYTHRTHRTLTPLSYNAGQGAPYYPGCPWTGCMPASDQNSYGVNPPPPPAVSNIATATTSPQGWAGVTPSASTPYTSYLTYPNLNGYKTFFLPNNVSYEDTSLPAVADHSLPIYDPCAPLGYNPTEFWGINGFYKTPATLVTTMNLGSNINCMYPVIGTTTPTNGGVVGVGPTGARVGMPYVWSVYPSALAVRLFNGKAINWGGTQPAANNRPQGLTVITPNTCYIWGDYNTTKYPDASGTLQTTPCGVFCDGLTTLSNAWSDTGTTATYAGCVGASPTSYIVSVMINNQPTDYENTYEEGSDGTHNVIRYAENWGTGGSGGGASTWTFQGSLVVLNRTRYGRSYVPGSQSTSNISPFIISGGNSYSATTAGSFYGVPSRVYQFNSDLLTQAGQPPEAPHGITVQRVISTININNR